MYTLEEIKKAFWEAFHEQGELWFPYKEIAPEEECQAATTEHWEEFLEELKLEEREEFLEELKLEEREESNLTEKRVREIAKIVDIHKIAKEMSESQKHRYKYGMVSRL